nr:hypothetical protein CFP56_63949 [Quercus suber]
MESGRPTHLFQGHESQYQPETLDRALVDAQSTRAYTPMPAKAGLPSAAIGVTETNWDSTTHRPEIVESRAEQQSFPDQSTDVPGLRSLAGKRRLSQTRTRDSGLPMHMMDAGRRTTTSLLDVRGIPPSRETPMPRASLPPFASLQQHTGYLDEPDGPEIAPMYQRIACLACTNLKPLVHDVAVATADLEGCVQAICNTDVTRMSEIPADNSLKRTAHWILDRLRYAKFDLQESQKRRSNSDATPTVPISSMTSHKPLKRATEHYDRNNPYSGKRSRQHYSPEQQSWSGTELAPYQDRRASFDTTTGKGQLPPISSSPPRSESAVGSVHQGNSSPRHHAMRSLPSPAPSAYVLPGSSSSLPPSTVKSSGSPVIPFRSTMLSHASSSDSVASALLEDLQHQVALKSLALETLQSKYSSLMQKVEHESLQHHASDMKIFPAGQNVNGLTSKNQELHELVKSLEAHVRSLEVKREEERADAAKDKEQWGRMLDMSSRIQARQAEQCQKLKIEKDDLVRRISTQVKPASPISPETQMPPAEGSVANSDRQHDHSGRKS